MILKKKRPEGVDWPEEPMTVDAYLEWHAAQPDGMRCELSGGYIQGPWRQSERLTHAVAKGEMFRQFDAALRAKGDRSCRAFSDGMAIRIAGDATYEPDASIRCGPRLPGDTIALDDPVLVVEVTSPSSQSTDISVKRVDYFRNPHVVHMLVLNVAKRVLIHEYRAPGLHPSLDTVSRVHHSSVVEFDPPGVGLDLDAVWAELPDDGEGDGEDDGDAARAGG